MGGLVRGVDLRGLLEIENNWILDSRFGDRNASRFLSP